MATRHRQITRRERRSPARPAKILDQQRRRFVAAVREFLDAESLWTWGPNPPEPLSAATPPQEYIAARGRYEREAREAIQTAKLYRGDKVLPARADHPLAKVLKSDLLPPRRRQKSGAPPGRPRIKVTREQIANLKRKKPGAPQRLLAQELGISQRTFSRRLLR